MIVCHFSVRDPQNLSDFINYDLIINVLAKYDFSRGAAEPLRDFLSFGCTLVYASALKWTTKYTRGRLAGRLFQNLPKFTKNFKKLMINVHSFSYHERHKGWCLSSYFGRARYWERFPNSLGNGANPTVVHFFMILARNFQNLPSFAHSRETDSKYHSNRVGPLNKIYLT